MPIFKGPTKDQDRLGVPALMRKRTLYSRKRATPIPLTALDRKKAGLPPPGLEKGRKRKVPGFLPARKSFNSQEFFERPKKARMPRAPRIKKIKQEIFAPPLMDFYATPEPIIEEAPTVATAPKKAIKKQISIGEMTHYYDKIKVGVIKLSTTLSVGDSIKFETADGGEYEQVVESMEIDREPVFKAGKGKEVGLKLSRAPREGCGVIKI